MICGNSMDGMSSCFSEDMVITPNTDAKTVISAIRARLAERQLCEPEHLMVSWWVDGRASGTSRLQRSQTSRNPAQGR